MNKEGFITLMSEKTGFTKKDTKVFVDALPEAIRKAVIEEDKLQFVGFMTFEKKIISAKEGVTKLGGEEKAWSTPEHPEIKCTLSKNYKMI